MALHRQCQPQAVVAGEDVAFLRAVAALLQDRGIKVVGVAKGGAPALAAVEITQPDVLVIDLELPDVDGVSVTSAVRRDFPATQVVCLAPAADERLRAAAAAAGAWTCVVKGGHADDLTAAVRAAASR